MSIPKYTPDVSLLQMPKAAPIPIKPKDAKEYDKASVEQVLYFLGQGYTKKSIAEAYDVKESTISKWVKQYDADKESEKDQAAPEPDPDEVPVEDTPADETQPVEPTETQTDDTDNNDKES